MTIVWWTVYVLLTCLGLNAVIIGFLFFMGALGQQADLERLHKAGEALYVATRWRSSEPNKLSLDEEARLWTEFRNALDLEPGTATIRGVGDPNAKQLA